jgi:hypothetical protein
LLDGAPERDAVLRSNLQKHVDVRPLRWKHGVSVRAFALQQAAATIPPGLHTNLRHPSTRPRAISGATMEWTCAKCGQVAKTDDWTLLLSMGWRITPEDEFRCVICAKRLLAREQAPPRVEPMRRRSTGA